MNKLNLSLLTTLLPSLLCVPTISSANPMVELFTSQGCYSCPAADEFLGELLEERPEVVALEFHVDYWDDLHYGAAGVWKDPFSDPSYTTRQRRYNAIDLAGKRGVYTPQMIVNGTTAQVGSSRRAVLKALKQPSPEVRLEAVVEGNQLAVDIQDESRNGSTLWLAIFDRLQITDVQNGENHGKTMVNHHVVSELIPLGKWQGDKVSQTFQLPSSFSSDGADDIEGSNRGCAIFLQDEQLGQVHGATYCESTKS